MQSDASCANRWVVTRLGANLEKELDFTIEASNAGRLARCMARNSCIAVPTAIPEVNSGLSTLRIGKDILSYRAALPIKMAAGAPGVCNCKACAVQFRCGRLCPLALNSYATNKNLKEVY